MTEKANKRLCWERLKASTTGKPRGWRVLKGFQTLRDRGSQEFVMGVLVIRRGGLMVYPITLMALLMSYLMV